MTRAQETLTPYYQDDLVRLFHGDSRQVNTWLGADVLVTDPPYGIAYKPKRGHRIQGDSDLALRDHLLWLWGDKPAIVFGRWDQPRPAQTRARLIWDKGNSPGMGNLDLPWGRSDEEIYILGHGFTGARTGSILRSRMFAAGDRHRPDHPTPKPTPSSPRRSGPACRPARFSSSHICLPPPSAPLAQPPDYLPAVGGPTD